MDLPRIEPKSGEPKVDILWDLIEAETLTQLIKQVERRINLFSGVKIADEYRPLLAKLESTMFKVCRDEHRTSLEKAESVLRFAFAYEMANCLTAPRFLDANESFHYGLMLALDIHGPTPPSQAQGPTS